MANRRFTIADLPYLRSQQGDLVSLTKVLKMQAAQDKNCRAGAIFSVGCGVVGNPEHFASRRKSLEQLKELIRDLKAEAKLSSSSQDRSCLKVECTAKCRTNSKWVVCPACNRGFCKKCEKTNSISEHRSVCIAEGPELADDPSTSPEFLDFDSFEDHSSSDDFEESCSDAELFASELPQTGLVIEGGCIGCGSTNRISVCPLGHSRCPRCKVSCTSCHSSRARMKS